MNPSEVWVLIPVIYRPANLRRVLGSLKDNPKGINIMVAIEADDIACQEVAQVYGAQVTKCSEKQGGCAKAWNDALRAAPASASAYVLGADDLVFTPGWFDEAVKALQKIGGSGVVGFNDLHKDASKFPATHFLMTRDYLIKHNGGVIACPHYLSVGVDVEIVARAQKAGRYVYAPAAIVEHDWNGRHPDEWFRKGQKSHNRTKQLLIDRERAGWPDDFRAVIR